jgi:hypothetical protein
MVVHHVVVCLFVYLQFFSLAAGSSFKGRAAFGCFQSAYSRVSARIRGCATAAQVLFALWSGVLRFFFFRRLRGLESVGAREENGSKLR